MNLPLAIREDNNPFTILGFFPGIQRLLIFVRWTNYHCPFCEGVFRRDYWPNNVRLGSGERTCKNCGKVFDDSAREWPELRVAKKLRFFFPPGAIAMGVSFFLFCGIGPIVVAPRDVVNWLVVAIVLAVSLSPTLTWCLIRMFFVFRSIHRYESESASMHRRLGTAGS